jgi:putative membrane protein
MMDSGMGDHGGMMGQGMGYAGYGSVLWILLLVLIGLAVYYVVKKEGGAKLKDKELLAIGGAVLLVLLLGGSMMGVGMGIGLIFWVLLIVLVYYLIAGKGKVIGGESSQEILDRRYAKGEISREEYLRMKEEIIKK